MSETSRLVRKSSASTQHTATTTIATATTTGQATTAVKAPRPACGLP